MFPSSSAVLCSARAAFPAALVSAFVRSSRRCPSGLVCSLSFSSFGAASCVARFWSARLPAASAPRARRVGEVYSVSVPVVLS